MGGGRVNEKVGERERVRRLKGIHAFHCQDKVGEVTQKKALQGRVSKHKM